VDAASPLAPLAAAPGRSALLFDLDGTLAPIVARPELASVPDETRSELARLVGRYRLVGCISGRPEADAVRLLRVDGVETVGNHGLELHPDGARLVASVASFRRQIGERWPVEDKGLSLSLHYRGAQDERAAIGLLEPIAREAEAAGLVPRWGRKVLEIRPSADADKATAVQALLARSEAGLGLYAGDDTTDLDAFRGLRDAGLSHAVAVAVASGEADASLLAAADVVVDGPSGLLNLIRLL
jgi:trehalose 6-phosphate phosphatase